MVKACRSRVTQMRPNAAMQRPEPNLTAAFGTCHFEYVVDDGVFVVAAAGDRLHRGGVEPAVLDEGVVDIDPDDVAEHHVAVHLAAFEVVKADRLDPLALQRTGRGRDTRRLHEL